MMLGNRFLIGIIFNLVFTISTQAKTYYFDAIRGNDLNNGVSLTAPFQSLSVVESLSLMPGDTILLMANQIFFGTLKLIDVKGTEKEPVVVSSYVWGNTLESAKATIKATGYLNGILIQNCSFLHVEDLSITANGGGVQPENSGSASMRCGVLVTVNNHANSESIKLSNLEIKDIFFEDEGHTRAKGEVRTSNGTASYGWGIRVINKMDDASISDMIVMNCIVENVGHSGIRFSGKKHNIRDIKVYNNKVIGTGGPGLQASGVLQGHFRGNYVAHSGSNDDGRKWGRGSGLWTWGCDHILIEKNHFLYADGPADSAGCHIDFNCNHVIVQYNFSAYNAGGFCEILGNNFNCCYRYNISVNDGHRTKGVDGAFQQGKTYWLSGYVGKKKKRHGPYNSYFYNNTIYGNKELISKIAVSKTAKGVLIANNIFYFKGKSEAVLGDQYNPEVGGYANIPNVFFENNLFLSKEYWPKEVLIQPKGSMFGDPRFVNTGGSSPQDYVPRNTQLIRNKGINIPKLIGDELGLQIGLSVSEDFFGNKIMGMPDLGAISCPIPN